jgi:hypothetical protein
VAGDKNVAFTIQHQLGVGERVVHGYLATSLRASAGGNLSTDFVRLFDTNPAHRIDFSELGWDTAVSASEPFVGVIDLGPYMNQLQTGSVNVQVNDDTGLDWAMYVITVAMPMSDPIGPTVILDGGGVTTLDTAVPDVRALQVGGSSGGHLRIETAGQIHVNDDYIQLADGALSLELNASFLENSSIQVADEAHLAGMLAVELASGYVPMLGDEFQILSATGGVFGAFDGVLLPTISSGLGWKLAYNSGEAVLQVVLPGDYNGDNIVDAADYVVWRMTFGQMGNGLAADGNGNGEIDSGDFILWRAHFGQTVGGGSTTRGGVPEPQTLAMLLMGALGIFRCRFVVGS